LIASFLGLGAISFFVITSCQKEKASIFAGQESSETPALTPSCEAFCSECGDDPCSPRTVLEAVTAPDDAANSQVNMISLPLCTSCERGSKKRYLSPVHDGGNDSQ